MDITFLITTYNSEKFLKNAIESCLYQDNHNLKTEVLVINDGSTDNSFKILDHYVNKNKITVFNQKNSGIEKAINLGFKKGNGNFFIRVDADDFLHIDYLMAIEKFLVDLNTFYYTNYLLVDVDGNLIREVKLPNFDINEIKKRGDFMATGTIFSRNLINKFGLYQEEVKNCGLENYDFILKLISNGVKGKLIPRTLLSYRRHDSNMSVEKTNSILKFGSDIASKYNLKKYSTNKFHPYGLKI